MAQWTIKAAYDAEAQVWYSVEGDVPGLAADGETIEALAAKVGAMLPDLLGLNADLIADTSRLAGPHSIRIIAHDERDFDVAA